MTRIRNRLEILNKRAAKFLPMFSLHLWDKSVREMESLAPQQKREKGCLRAGVNYLNTITASNNLHPSLASSLSTVATSPSHVWVSFPVRSARHSVIPQGTLLAPMENLSDILKQPLLLAPLSPACLKSSPMSGGRQVSLTVRL